MKSRTAAIVLALGLCGAPAGALMIKAPLADLVAGAEAIVLGRVTDVRCSWSLDGNLIVTVVSIQIQQTLKGRTSAPTIIIQTPGGQIGDLRLDVSDAPRFRTEESVLVFLKSPRPGFSPANSILALRSAGRVYEILEKAQGKYSIDADGMAQKNGYHLLAPDTAGDASLPLSELKLRIRSLLRNPAPAQAKNHD
jgi:hypothetical protein